MLPDWSKYFIHKRHCISKLTKLSQFSYSDNCLYYSSEGSYHSAQPLSNITITGLAASPNGHYLKRDDYPSGPPQEVSCNYGGKDQDSGLQTSYENGVLKVSGTADITSDGAFEQEMKLCFEW